MQIQKASELSGLSVKTIRYYEDVGLVPEPGRTENGYRDYTDKDVRFLIFVHRARDLGFTMEECETLISLYLDRDRKSAEVKSLAEGKIVEVDRKLRELQTIRKTLQHLADECHGDDHPDCPILDDLAGEGHC